jgi:pimeloyl-ACP methyl ester carboxylesterase
VSFNQEDVFQNHMEDVEDIVAALGLKDFLLAGYSLGATTALHWQNVGGFRNVRAYLHIDQSPCVRNHEGWPYGLFGPQQEWVFAQMTRLLPILENAPSDTLAGLPAESRQQLLGVLGDIFSRMLGKHFIKSLFSLGVRLPWVVAPLLPMSRVADLRAYLISYTRLGRDYLPGLTGCNTPVTVLIGARSPLYAEAGQRSVAEVVKQGRVVVLEKSGHVPLIDQPFVFARELKRFLHQSR